MIGLITYDAPHRKTQDLLSRLLMEGYADLHLIVIPWKARKPFVPFYKHRPSSCVDIGVDDLAARLGLAFTRVDVDNIADLLEEKAFRHVMIAGAGLLPGDLVNKHKIINAHPGYLPNVRGLDALKWAIYNDEIIGVTTHYISEEADEGLLIEKRTLQLEPNDTFHSLAYRQYETEIAMMINTIRLLDEGNAPLTSLSDDRYVANRRMPTSLEEEMMERLNRKRSSLID